MNDKALFLIASTLIAIFISVVAVAYALTVFGGYVHA